MFPPCLRVTRGMVYAINSRHVNLCQQSSVRTLLSTSYSCELQWENRLKNELLMKISPDAFFSELSQRYVKKMKVGAIDIDVFANVVTREDQLEELQHLLYKLRSTKWTKDTLESTHHAVCRAFLRFNAGDRLLKLLLDPVGCGIFPDQYSYNMIMDYFIEKKEFENASKVASLMMLQEDSGNEISKILALFSLNMHLKDVEERGQVEIADQTKEDNNEDAKKEVKGGDDEEEEIQYIRVPYVRNYYFDDHFDLKDPILICGKSLYFFGKELNDIVGRSDQIIGLALYQKWRKCKNLLEAFSEKHTQEKVILRAAADKLVKMISEIPDVEENENENKEKNVDDKRCGEEILQLIGQMEQNGKISEEDLHNLILEKVKLIKNLEQNDIKEMPNLFLEWEVNREKALTQQLHELAQEERKREIENKKKSVLEKERLLFFFENFSKHEMDFDQAEKRINELKLKTQVEEEYIPPEMS